MERKEEHVLEETKPKSKMMTKKKMIGLLLVLSAVGAAVAAYFMYMK